MKKISSMAIAALALTVVSAKADEASNCIMRSEVVLSPNTLKATTAVVSANDGNCDKAYRKFIADQQSIGIHHLRGKKQAVKATMTLQNFKLNNTEVGQPLYVFYSIKKKNSRTVFATATTEYTNQPAQAAKLVR